MRNKSEVSTNRWRATMEKKYGENWREHMRQIGSKGGSAEHSAPRGFALHPETAVEAGRKGGRISRRRPTKQASKPVEKIQIPVQYVDSEFGEEWARLDQIVNG